MLNSEYEVMFKNGILNNNKKRIYLRETCA